MPLEENEKHLKEMDELEKQYPTDSNLFRFGYFKGYIDVTLGSGTAFYFDPYEYDPNPAGLPQMCLMQSSNTRLLLLIKWDYRLESMQLGIKRTT